MPMFLATFHSSALLHATVDDSLSSDRSQAVSSLILDRSLKTSLFEQKFFFYT